MSEATESPSPAATAEKPPVAEAPPEPPFTTDLLQSCTARFTHKAWRLYQNNRQNVDFLREAPVRATLQARTVQGAEELQQTLVAEGVREISRNDVVLSFTATFETIQKVIRHPQTLLLDAVHI